VTARRTISPEVRRLFDEVSAAPNRAEGVRIVEGSDMATVPAAEHEWVAETLQTILENLPR
jgi:hypothetical protein